MAGAREEIWRAADERRAGFDAIASAYDTYRPGYPEESFDDLMALARLQAGDAVVEVGSGTGIATLPLVQRGLVVTCLEPGAAMAAVAQTKLAGFSGVTHVEERFEAWDAPPASARAVVAANAWHWVAPDIGFRQAATVLGPGGCLCLFFHHVVQVGVDGFAEELRAVRDAIAPPTESSLRQGAFLEDHVWSDDMEESGLFAHVATTRHGFTRDLNSAEFVAVSNTYGPASRLSPEVRAQMDAAVTALIDSRYDGHVPKSEQAVLYVGRRAD
jgi:SAM-dependent methyltransferase